jgi:hypothetical protein
MSRLEAQVTARRDRAIDEILLETTSFEGLRALTGRRSLGQVQALDWTGDPAQYLPAFTWGPFRPAESDLVE